MLYLDEIVSCYEDILKNFCAYSAEVMRMSERLERKEPVSMQKLVFASLQLADYKEELLRCKEVIGFTDGLLFMEEDSLFSGFSIESGRLKGNPSSVYEITDRWARLDFGDPKFCNFKYEVAIYARCLANPSYMTEEEMYTQYGVCMASEAVNAA